MVGAILSEDQVESLLRSQRACEDAQEKTAVELESIHRRFDELVDLSGEIERLSTTQIEAAEARAAQAANLRLLEERQRIDDEERTEREGARKTLVLGAKILGPLLGVILLPLVGWGGRWLATDYGETRTRVATQRQEVVVLKERAERDRTSAAATRSRADENRISIGRIDGRLEGIEGGQRTILEELRRRPPRRR